MRGPQVIDERQAPPRLLETAGPAGDCLREVLAQQELGERPPRFAVLRERRLRRVRRQRGLALVGLAALALICFRSLHEAEEPSPGISAELASRLSGHGEASVPSTSATATSAGREGEAVVPEAPRKPVPRFEAATSASAKPAAARATVEPLTRADEHAGAAIGARPVSDDNSGTAKACAELARAGAAERALSCYSELASGNGISAELALFERARLEGKVLRRPERARLTLEEYRRRFPQGSLRAEVMLAQIDWLLASGDSARALQLVDEALGSGLLRERTAELERLRTTLTTATAPAARD
jgi:hypothetical protein